MTSFPTNLPPLTNSFQYDQTSQSTVGSDEALFVRSSHYALSALNLSGKSPVCKTIDLSGKCITEEEFDGILGTIEKNGGVKKLRVSQEDLTVGRKEKLMTLTSYNSLKGLRIVSENNEPVGPVYTNWKTYAAAKKDAYKEGMSETVNQALNQFINRFNKPPEFVIDFGAGPGKDTINLALSGCNKIHAIDGHKKSITYLETTIAEMKERGVLPDVDITCTNAPFINLVFPQQAELLVCMFTLPYRCPSEFLSCWNKCVTSVVTGGIIAVNFFGPIKNKTPDPGVTYHTEEEVKELLRKDFEIIWFLKEPEGKKFKIFGGGEPTWGDLHNVVAIKTAP